MITQFTIYTDGDISKEHLTEFTETSAYTYTLEVRNDRDAYLPLATLRNNLQDTKATALIPCINMILTNITTLPFEVTLANSNYTLQVRSSHEPI